MNKIFYLPLEVMDGRYTEMMDDLLMQEFDKQEVNVLRVYGNADIPKHLAPGLFLDACATNEFKFSQLIQMMHFFRKGAVKDGDVIFVSDLWFPGLEALKYTAMFLKIRIKIVGVMHAGSWTATDWLNHIEPWAREMEQGWFKMFDRVYLGSEWHKHEILTKGRCVEQGKLFVTGCAWSTPYVLGRLYADEAQPLSKPAKDRENIVIFPHRITDEKQPGAFKMLKAAIEDMGAKVVTTQELQLSKVEYYKALSEAKVMVSFALQENFGYATCEAIAMGCVPVVPNKVSYLDYVPRKYRYDSFDECVALVRKYLQAPEECPVSSVRQFDNSVPEMVRLTKEVMG